jgi:hypothetical protein
VTCTSPKMISRHKIQSIRRHCVALCLRRLLHIPVQDLSLMKVESQTGYTDTHEKQELRKWALLLYTSVILLTPVFLYRRACRWMCVFVGEGCVVWECTPPPSNACASVCVRACMGSCACVLCQSLHCNKNSYVFLFVITLCNVWEFAFISQFNWGDWRK